MYIDGIFVAAVKASFVVQGESLYNHKAFVCHPVRTYRSADKSLARPGRKQVTATADFDVHISYL